MTEFLRFSVKRCSFSSSDAGARTCIWTNKYGLFIALSRRITKPKAWFRIPSPAPSYYSKTPVNAGVLCFLGFDAPFAGDCLATENQACATKSPRTLRKLPKILRSENSAVQIYRTPTTVQGTAHQLPLCMQRKWPPPFAQAIWSPIELGLRAPTQRSTPMPDIELPPFGSPSGKLWPNRRLPAGNSLGYFGAGNDF